MRRPQRGPLRGTGRSGEVARGARLLLDPGAPANPRKRGQYDQPELTSQANPGLLKESSALSRSFGHEIEDSARLDAGGGRGSADRARSGQPGHDLLWHGPARGRDPLLRDRGLAHPVRPTAGPEPSGAPLALGFVASGLGRSVAHATNRLDDRLVLGTELGSE